MKVIDLNRFRTQGVRVFAGRERGEAVRKEVGLDEIDLRTSEDVEVRVPEDTYSINSSFFLGLFGDSIRHLGEDEFRRRFQFTGKRIGRVYEASIQEALTTDSPFSSDIK